MYHEQQKFGQYTLIQRPRQWNRGAILIDKSLVRSIYAKI